MDLATNQNGGFKRAGCFGSVRCDSVGYIDCGEELELGHSGQQDNTRAGLPSRVERDVLSTPQKGPFPPVIASPQYIRSSGPPGAQQMSVAP